MNNKGALALYVILFLIALLIASAAYWPTKIYSVTIPIQVHDYHDEQSPVIGTLPPDYSIYAMYDNGQSCWAIVKMGNQLGWVNTDQLLSARSKCWSSTGYATSTPSICIQDRKNNSCVR